MWYSGTVSSFNPKTQRHKVTFDDGDSESGVPASRIRGEAQNGKKVQVNWQDKGTYYPGRLRNCGGGGGSGCTRSPPFLSLSLFLFLLFLFIHRLDTPKF